MDALGGRKLAWGFDAPELYPAIRLSASGGLTPIAFFCLSLWKQTLELEGFVQVVAGELEVSRAAVGFPLGITDAR
jgi:hypothetical protein